MTDMSEYQYIITNLSLLGIVTLSGVIVASIIYSWLEHLCWKYLEWKNRVEK